MASLQSRYANWSITLRGLGRLELSPLLFRSLWCAEVPEAGENRMHTVKLISALSFAAGCIALAVSGNTFQKDGAEVQANKVAELFDPAVMQSSICGAGAVRQPSLLRQALALAAPRSADAATQTAADALPPLYTDLGTLTYNVTSSVPMAQAYFDQGLRFTYAFNHAEAVRSFQTAQQLDPSCALCAWGEAYALGPNINAPMAPDVVPQVLAAMDRAQQLAGNSSQREQALIAALAQRYGEDAASRPPPYNRAFATAMLDVHQQYPDDPEIALIAADAIMNETPWNYWQADGSTPEGRVGESIALVEGILADYPLHPGAIHAYIHLVEASTTPERAEPFADALNGLMPGAGHIVHMPSHIYYRIGRYVDSLETNIVAVDVDEDYFRRPEAIKGGMYQFGYYPHNVHFVLVSAQMAGDADVTLDFAARVDELLPMAMVETAPWVQPVKVSPLFAYAEFDTPERVLALPDPGDDAPYVKAMWHCAQALAHVRSGALDAALDHVDAIAAINENADFSALMAGNVPAPRLLSIAQQVILGRIAQAEGDLEAAIRHFEAGASLQDLVNYMEPPYWYYPVRQSLGAAYFAAGRLDEAEQALRESLILAPNNGLALYGLVEVYRAQGDEAAAAQTERLLPNAWAGSEADLTWDRL